MIKEYEVAVLKRRKNIAVVGKKNRSYKAAELGDREESTGPKRPRNNRKHKAPEEPEAMMIREAVQELKEFIGDEIAAMIGKLRPRHVPSKKKYLKKKQASRAKHGGGPQETVTFCAGEVVW